MNAPRGYPGAPSIHHPSAHPQVSAAKGSPCSHSPRGAGVTEEEKGRVQVPAVSQEPDLSALGAGGHPGHSDHRRKEGQTQDSPGRRMDASDILAPNRRPLVFSNTFVLDPCPRGSLLNTPWLPPVSSRCPDASTGSPGTVHFPRLRDGLPSPTEWCYASTRCVTASNRCVCNR